MRVESPWYDEAVTNNECGGLDMLAPCPRYRWWGESEAGKIEAEMICFLATELTGVEYHSGAHEYSNSAVRTGSFTFIDDEWAGNLRIGYAEPRIIWGCWKNERKLPTCFMALEFFTERIRGRGQGEGGVLTIFAGVRRVDTWDTDTTYETVWFYDSRLLIEWQKKYCVEGLPQTMWGSLNLRDPEMRKYLPHRWLMKKP